MNIRKKAIIALLSVFIILITLVPFIKLSFLSAYSSEEIILELGSSISAQNIVKPDNNKKLVPVGAVLGLDDVYTLEVTYEVKLDNTDKELKLNVYVSNILIGGKADYAHLVNIDLIYNDNLSNEISYVKAVISLNMPTNEVEYLGVANQQISYLITFEAQK